MTDTSLPTIKDELDRKTFETLEWLTQARDTGQISPAQFSIALDALFMATSGLVDRGVIDIISAASGIARAEPVKRVFVRGHEMLVISRNGEDLAMRAYIDGEPRGDGSFRSFASATEADERVRTIVARLRADRYTEL